MKMNQSPIVQTSRLGLGTGTLGTLGSSANVGEVGRLLDKMLNMGITIIDTADTYGSGQAERLLGAALRGRRERFFLMTKAGYRHGDLPWPLRHANPFLKKALHSLGHRQCFEPAYLEHSLRRSLKRLGTDRVDVFFLHDPSMADIEKLDGLGRIKHLNAKGMASCLGVSSGDPDVIEAALAGNQVDFIQSPANLFDADRLLKVWKTCSERGIRMVANHVMGRGDFGIPELTHEIRLKAASALLPPDSIILCGTRNVRHLTEANQWLEESLAHDTALQFLQLVRRAQS